MTDSRRHGALVLLGGAGGLGGSAIRACALERPDQPVIVTYANDQASAESLCASIGRGQIVRVSLGSQSPFAELIRIIDEAELSVAGLVHGAVHALPGTLVERSTDLAACLEVSALSLVGVVSALDNRLLPRASIVYLTSIGSSRVVPQYGAIGIAKAAGEAAVRYLAHELGARGIRVNSVGSGPTATKAFTNMFGDNSHEIVDRLRSRSPLNPPSDELAVAQAVSYLIHSDSGTTGQLLTVDGGLFLT